LKQLIEAAGLPGEPPPIGAERMRQAMQLDKKASSGTLKFVLLRELGDAFTTTEYSDSLLSEILQSADGKRDS
jgi:3-dehydroquinate synthase